MNQNHRQYSRCPLTTESAAVLVVNQRKLPCQLTEVSIGGFAVIADRPLAELHEPLVCLKADGLEYIVRITRQEQRADGYLIALEQVEEVVPENPLTATSPLSQSLTWIAWSTAICIVAAAIYCLSGSDLPASLSLHSL
jgi:hypothetical protein